MTPTNKARRRPPPIRRKPSRFRCTPFNTSRLPDGGCLQKASVARRRGIIGTLKMGSDHNGVTEGRTIEPRHTPRWGDTQTKSPLPLGEAARSAGEGGFRAGTFALVGHPHLSPLPAGEGALD